VLSVPCLLSSSLSTRCDVTRWLFNLLFALDDGGTHRPRRRVGIRTELGAIYSDGFTRPRWNTALELRTWSTCVTYAKWV